MNSRHLILPHLLASPAIQSVFLAGSDIELVIWLLEHSQALIHVASPAFGFDAAAMKERAGDRIMLHPAPVAVAMMLMPVPDLLIIDGNANWYAVSTALQAAARQASRLAAAFPLTLVTDTSWPYARRDHYPDPAALPAEFVRPHERAGLLPGQSSLAPSLGLFPDRTHARSDNEPRNGVLTAMEEFLLEQDGRLGCASVPMLHGASLIYDRKSPLPQHVSDALAAVHLGAAARALAEATERGRVEQAAETARLQMAIASAQYRNDAISRVLDQERAERQRQLREAVLPQENHPQPMVQRAVRKALLAAGLRRRDTQAADAAQTAQEASQIGRLRQTPIFDAAWYRSRYDDIGASDIDPAEHYFRHGAAENRDPGPAFSTRFYLETYTDVAEAGHNPLLHYLAQGAQEGRDPDPQFSSAFYLESNPDVASAGLNPLEHYLMSGQKEGRRPRQP